MSAAVLQVAENLWQQYAANINQGAMAKIVIDPMVGYALGDDGISFIAERFKYVTIIILGCSRYSSFSDQ